MFNYSPYFKENGGNHEIYKSIYNETAETDKDIRKIVDSIYNMAIIRIEQFLHRVNKSDLDKQIIQDFANATVIDMANIRMFEDMAKSNDVKRWINSKPPVVLFVPTFTESSSLSGVKKGGYIPKLNQIQIYLTSRSDRFGKIENC